MLIDYGTVMSKLNKFIDYINKYRMTRLLRCRVCTPWINTMCFCMCVLRVRNSMYTDELIRRPNFSSSLYRTECRYVTHMYHANSLPTPLPLTTPPPPSTAIWDRSSTGPPSQLTPNQFRWRSWSILTRRSRPAEIPMKCRHDWWINTVAVPRSVDGSSSQTRSFNSSLWIDLRKYDFLRTDRTNISARCPVSVLMQLQINYFNSSLFRLLSARIT